MTSPRILDVRAHGAAGDGSAKDAPPSARVKCIGNDLTAAEHPFAADMDVEQAGNLV